LNGAQSWNDLSISQPGDIRDCIADAALNLTQGTFKRSTTFLQSAWVPFTFGISGEATCIALDGSNGAKVAEASQWNYANQTVNTSSSLAPPIRKIIFLRGGSDQWQMKIPIDFGGITVTDVQISYRDNGASGGTFIGGSTGSIPVVHFSGTFTGTADLFLTLKQFGRFPMLIVLKNNATSDYSAVELEFIIVP
jgi:hypothetical protein